MNVENDDHILNEEYCFSSSLLKSLILNLFSFAGTDDATVKNEPREIKVKSTTKINISNDRI